MKETRLKLGPTKGTPVKTESWKRSASVITLAVLSWTGVALLNAAALQPTVLYSFSNSDSDPSGNLVAGPDGNFYGVTQVGGPNQWGTVFRITLAGSVTTLAYLDNPTTGRDPWSKLTFGKDGNLYGTAFEGGASQWGTLFKVTTNGSLTTLVTFDGANGGGPMGAMALGNDGSLYGTTRNGGSYGFGTVFKVTPAGVLTTLVNFSGANGSRPQGDLILGKDGNFYGTTYYGGINSGGDDGFDGTAPGGTVFKITPGGVLTTIASFDGSNGENPWAGVTFGPDGNLYGSTSYGGTYGLGTIFRLTPRGKLKTLVNFNLTNGALPLSSLTLAADGNFYGTTPNGGPSISTAIGTIFKLTPDGTLINLFSFVQNDNGRPYGGFPYAGLTPGADGSLYGTTLGDNSGIYRLDLPPAITSQPDSRFKALGTTVSFSVTTVGTQPFSYQWLKDGTALADGGNVSGSGSNTLTLSNLQKTDAGNYSVRVANIAGTITSSTAALTILHHGQSALVSLVPNMPAPSAPTNTSGTSPQPLLSNSPVNALTFEGTPSYPYVVQYTTDLLHSRWLTLSTNTADTNGTCLVIDPAPTDPQRFYRCFSQ